MNNIIQSKLTGQFLTYIPDQKQNEADSFMLCDQGEKPYQQFNLKYLT